MHAIFHIKTVIIPRDRFRPKGFSTYFNIDIAVAGVYVWAKSILITYKYVIKYVNSPLILVDTKSDI